MLTSSPLPSPCHLPHHCSPPVDPCPGWLMIPGKPQRNEILVAATGQNSERSGIRMGRRNLCPSPFPGKRHLLKELLEHWSLSLASSKPSFLHPTCPVRALLPGSPRGHCPRAPPRWAQACPHPGAGAFPRITLLFLTLTTCEHKPTQCPSHPPPLVQFFGNQSAPDLYT